MNNLTRAFILANGTPRVLFLLYFVAPFMASFSIALGIQDTTFRVEAFFLFLLFTGLTFLLFRVGAASQRRLHMRDIHAVDPLYTFIRWFGPAAGILTATVFYFILW